MSVEEKSSDIENGVRPSVVVSSRSRLIGNQFKGLRFKSESKIQNSIINDNSVCLMTIK